MLRTVELDHALLARPSRALASRAPGRPARLRPARPLGARAPRPGPGRPGLGGQPGEAIAEQFAQALGNPQGVARCRPRVRPYELAPELQREERITGGQLLHSAELVPRQLESEPLLEQSVGRASVNGPKRSPRTAPPGSARASSSGKAEISGAVRSVARRLTGSSRRRRAPASCSRTSAEVALVSLLRCRRAPRPQAPGPARARSTSSTARPMAPGSGGCSPGSASQSATSSARRLGGGSDETTHFDDGLEQIGEPGEGERRLGLDRCVMDEHPVEAAARPPRGLPPRGRSCRSPARRRERVPR